MIINDNQHSPKLQQHHPFEANAEKPFLFLKTSKIIELESTKKTHRKLLHFNRITTQKMILKDKRFDNDTILSFAIDPKNDPSIRHVQFCHN